MIRTNNKAFDKAATAAFTGHRYYDFSKRDAIRQRLKRAILEAYDNGIRNFISGFATGVDLMAAQIVQSLKAENPDMMLTAAVPCKGQADKFALHDKRRYDELMKSADEVIVLSEHYYSRCFLDRDEFMVNHASCIIAYYDGRERGGTYYTVKKAREKGIPVTNVY